jgi:hypothetical protein
MSKGVCMVYKAAFLGAAAAAASNSTSMTLFV